MDSVDAIQEISNILSSKRLLNEAYGWQTNLVRVATVTPLAVDEHPLSKTYDQELATPGQRKDYSKNISKLVDQSQIRQLLDWHRSEIENERNSAIGAGKYNPDKWKPTAGITRKYLIDKLGSISISRRLYKEWVAKDKEKLSKHNQALIRFKAVLAKMWNDHNDRCGCTKGYQSSSFKLLSSNIINACKEQYDEEYTGRACQFVGTPSGAKLTGPLLKSQHIIELGKSKCDEVEHGSSYRYSNGLIGCLQKVIEILSLEEIIDDYKINSIYLPLDESELAILQQDPNNFKKLVDETHIKVDPKIVRTIYSLDDDIVSYIRAEYQASKEDNLNDFLQLLQSELEKLEDETDVEFKPYYLPRLYSNLQASKEKHDPDDVREAYSNIILNFDEYYERYKSNNSREIDPKDVGKNIINAIHTTTEKPETTILTDIPRYRNDKRPTVYDYYKRAKENKEEFGHSWLVITGYEMSSAVGSNDGKCTICGGSGIISPETIGLIIGGVPIKELIGKGIVSKKSLEMEKLEYEHGEKVTSLNRYDWPECENCDGTGDEDNEWFWAYNRESKLTPFDILFRSIWDVLKSGGYEPEAYDGFFRKEDDLGLVEPDHYPLPLPKRPRVWGMFGNLVKNEANVSGYTSIIKLNKPFGSKTLEDDAVNRPVMQAHFKDELGPMLTLALRAKHFGSELEYSDLGVTWSRSVELTKKSGIKEKERSRKIELDIWTWYKVKEYDETAGVAVQKAERGWRQEMPEAFKQHKEESEFEEKSKITPSQDFLANIMKLMEIGNNLIAIGRPIYAHPIWVFLKIHNKYGVPPKSVKKFEHTNFRNLLKFVYQLLDKDEFSEKREDSRGKDAIFSSIEKLMHNSGLFDLENLTDLPSELSIFIKGQAERHLYARAKIFGSKRNCDELSGAKSTETLIGLARDLVKIRNKDEPLKFNPGCYILIALGAIAEATYYCDVDDNELLSYLLGFEEFGAPEHRSKNIYKLYDLAKRGSKTLGSFLLELFEHNVSTGNNKTDALIEHIKNQNPGFIDKVKLRFPGIGFVDKIIGDPFRLSSNDLYRIMITAYEQLDNKVKSDNNYKKFSKRLNYLKSFISTARNRLKVNDRKRETYKIRELEAMRESITGEKGSDDDWREVDSAFEDNEARFSESYDASNPDHYKRKVEYDIVCEIFKMFTSLISVNPKYSSKWHQSQPMKSLDSFLPYLSRYLNREYGWKISLNGLGGPNSQDRLFYPGLSESTNIDTLERILSILNDINSGDKDLVPIQKQIDFMEKVNYLDANP